MDSTFMTVARVAALVWLGLGCRSSSGERPDPLDGSWATLGYGHVIQASDGVVRMYERTASSCILFAAAPYDQGAIAGELLYTVAGDRLELRNQVALLHRVAERLPELPAACANGGTPRSADPELSFEVYSRTFAEQYVSFDLFGVDWRARSEQYRTMVSAGTSPDALFAILSEMTAPLNDPHVRLRSATREFSPAKPPDWSESAKRYLAARDFESGASTVIANQLIAYRRLPSGVGFLSIRAMEGFGMGQAGELAGAAVAIDQVIAALQDAPAMIIDVRLNTGGFDGVAMRLASRFADTRRLAYTRRARNGDTDTAPEESYVSPEGARQYHGPVILLVSGHTLSAAETFVMAMQTLPNVVTMGEPTCGAHSTVLQRSLPNGWTFELSNEVWLAADGERYEKRGIPPRVVAALEPEKFQSGTDAMLDSAEAYLASH